jgi:hypothetical protein
MKFIKNNVRTEWDDSLAGSSGYFADHIGNATDGCLEDMVIYENSQMFGKVTKTEKSDFPFRSEGHASWKYFYPVPVIKTYTETDNIIGVQCSFFLPAGNNDYESLKNHIIEFLKQMQCGINDYDFYAVRKNMEENNDNT